MPSVQIKDVPERTHAILRQRAAAAHQSLQEYLRARLIEEASELTLDEVLDRLVSDASDGNWGSDRTTADDMVVLLLRMSQDPWVGPSVLSWMGSAESTAADGFDQSFGLFALAGGVKQGWSDPDWRPRNLHSVGWTDRYFISILQTSPLASFQTMRSTSTTTDAVSASAFVSARNTQLPGRVRHVLGRPR